MKLVPLLLFCCWPAAAIPWSSRSRCTRLPPPLRRWSIWNRRTGRGGDPPAETGGLFLTLEEPREVDGLAFAQEPGEGLVLSLGNCRSSCRRTVSPLPPPSGC